MNDEKAGDVPAIVDAESLRVALRDWRARLGISQREAAHHLGVSAFSVESWERGHRFPGGRMLLKIIKEVSGHLASAR